MSKLLIFCWIIVNIIENFEDELQKQTTFYMSIKQQHHVFVSPLPSIHITSLKMLVSQRNIKGQIILRERVIIKKRGNCGLFPK